MLGWKKFLESKEIYQLRRLDLAIGMANFLCCIKGANW